MTKDPTIRVDLAGGFSVKQGRLERLIRLLTPLIELEEPATVEVDLSRLVTVSPAALALLIAVLKRISDLDLLEDGSHIVPPVSLPVRNYLLRMNLVRVLVGNGEAGLEEPFERRPAHGFRPCEHFTGSDDYARVARTLTEALTERCVTDQVARASIRVALDEIAENVVHHAASAVGGFGAAQGWPKNQEFEIAIVDLGVGVRASLIQNPEYADVGDDAAAIVKALEPRVSASPERNAGIGLFITKLLLAANGGLVFVRSGFGSVLTGAEERVRLETMALPGTLVALRARMDRPLDINAVYRLLDRDHPVPHELD